MNVEQKLTAIRDIIQQDVGNRGLARDPKENLITACPDDFEVACGVIAATPKPTVMIVIGFHIATASPPASETDGPLGAVFLARVLAGHNTRIRILADGTATSAIESGLAHVSLLDHVSVQDMANDEEQYFITPDMSKDEVSGWMRKRTWRLDQLIAIERPGPSLKDGRCYSMRGRDITSSMSPSHFLFEGRHTVNTIGIGDGGNEIGMGKIPHETIVKNIPNGDLIHCRVATDHLIVAGVSNWGAYALAAGVALLRGHELPAELFDPDREREILQVMVERGPLVDGVTGKQTATVDGLTWEQYIQPLVEIGRIVRA
ncbi:MAG TPA: DUF4392 domain-containing protein [Gemmataceae bacterium]|jgi:hypothetical protein|nr:DUF4392 domain-containing protein [Gemmataceae bacterium]